MDNQLADFASGMSQDVDVVAAYCDRMTGFDADQERERAFRFEDLMAAYCNRLAIYHKRPGAYDNEEFGMCAALVVMAMAAAHAGAPESLWREEAERLLDVADRSTAG